MPRSKKSMQWEENTTAAIESVRGGGKSNREVAAEVNVPKSTVGNRMKGELLTVQRMAPKLFSAKKTRKGWRHI